ncbi:MAG: HlyD family secretion protein [Planctomycetota bacterium]|jgi:multidrug efflux pump subunit AcrA (membrane-fusion protein)
MRAAYPVVIVLIVVLAGCKKKPPPPKEGPRPVTVMTLLEFAPTSAVKATGSVAPWTEEDVAFEVAARIEQMVEETTWLEGRWAEGGTVHIAGDIVGKLDSKTFAIRRETAAANLSVWQKALQTATVELEQVLPANARAAKAERDRAEAVHERNDAAYEKGAITEFEIIKSVADRDAARARHEQALAAIEQQKAAIEQRKARVLQAESDLREADDNLAKCTLWAPFPGEISKVYVEAGGYAQPGQAVAHLVMLDPMKVEVAVSSETARGIGLRDSVTLMRPGDDEPFFGNVYDKATAADPETRTFRVSILVRNQRGIAGLAADDPRRKLPRIDRIQYLTHVDPGNDASGFAIEERHGLRKDDQGYFVWAATGVTRDTQVRSGQSVLKLRKYRVKVGARRHSMQGIYLLREITDSGGLPRGALVAWDVPDDYTEGAEVLFASSSWRLRPGQVVNVILGKAVPKKGTWAPMAAIEPTGESEGYVFVVEGDHVRKVPVALREHVGALYRIEASEAAGGALLKAGAELVLDYIHFLTDGEAVQVVKRVEQRS